jgi:hypothetical protein
VWPLPATFDPRDLRLIATLFILFAPAHGGIARAFYKKSSIFKGLVVDSQWISYELTPYHSQ